MTVIPLAAVELEDGAVIDDARTDPHATMVADGTAEITSTGSITTNGTLTLSLRHDGWTVTNAGDLRNDSGNVLSITGAGTDFVNHGTIANDFDGYTVRMDAGTTSTLTNYGTIDNDLQEAIQMEAGTVVNHGLIEARGGAFTVATGGIATRIENHGTIRSETDTAIVRSTAADVLVNHGRIEGGAGTAVDMGAGDDLIRVGTGGSFVGTVDGGLGNDTLRLVGSGTFDQALANVEFIERNGSGTWILDADHTVTGTTVNGGELVVASGRTLTTDFLEAKGGTLSLQGNLVLNNPMVIGAGGTLSGIGTINGNVDNSGTLAPGNSIGTLTIVGNYTHSGGDYDVELAPDGRSDLLIVTGDVTINSGSIDILLQPGFYRPGTTYTILTAGGTLTGEFDGIKGGWIAPLYFWEDAYANNEVTLTLRRRPYLLVADTPGRLSVATALELLRPIATPDLEWSAVVLENQPTPEEVGIGFDRLSPKDHAHAGDAVLVSGDMHSRSIRDRLRRRRENAEFSGGQAPALWGEFLGSAGDRDGDFDVRGQDYDILGGDAGFDQRFGSLILGGSAAWFEARMTLDGGARTEALVWRGAAYGGFEFDPWYLEAEVGSAFITFDSHRRIDYGAIDVEARSRHDAWEVSSRVGTGLSWTFGAWSLEVETASRYVELHESSYREHGAGSLDLAVEERTVRSFTTDLGTRVGRAFDLHWATLRPEFQLRWQHQWEDDPEPVEARFRHYDAGEMRVFGLDPIADLWRTGLRADVFFAGDLAVFAGHVASFEGLDLIEHAFSAGFGWEF